MKKITICITSYNKPQKLIYLTKYLIKNISNEMQIYVFDNNSKSKTQDYLFSLKNKKIIKLFISKKNLGERYLIEKIQKTVKSKYFIILAEDDFININYLKVCMNIMDTNNKLNLIFSKTLIYNPKKSYYYLLNTNLQSKKIYKPSVKNLEKLSVCNIHLSSIFFRSKINIDKNIFTINIIDEQIFINYLASKNYFTFLNEIGSSFTVDKFSQSYCREIESDSIDKSLKKDLSFLKKNIRDKKILEFLLKFSNKIHMQYNSYKSHNEKLPYIKILLRYFVSFFIIKIHSHNIGIFKNFYLKYDR